MGANYKLIGSFPPAIPTTFSVRELVGNWVDRIDVEPEELQRGEVLSGSWAQGIIFSILQGVPLDGFKWTLQKTPYEKIGIKGYTITVEFKNTDGLQRITAIVWFTEGKVTTPGNKPEDFTIPWKDRDYPIGGMSFSEIKKLYPGLLEAKFLSRQLNSDIYGVEGNYCTAQQETYLFKYVANNQNEMNGQQWRNPTVSQIARDIRNDARLKPLLIFKNNPFSFGNSKFDYDEVAAVINHFIVYGDTKTINKSSLNSFYEHPDLEDGRDIYSVLFQKKINVRSYAKQYYNFMYQILKDKEKKSIMKKTSVYSLLWFSHIYLREGFQNLFNYDKLKEQFFRLHYEMKKPLPTGHKSLYRSCLGNNSDKNIKQALELWEEELAKETKHIIYRDSKRTFSKEEIEESLQKQNGLDPVDGKPLRLDEAVGGHDEAWSKGGSSKDINNCIAIRKEHNDDMGIQSLEEYKTNKES